jgi:hypothetical protein
MPPSGHYGRARKRIGGEIAKFGEATAFPETP